MAAVTAPLSGRIIGAHFPSSERSPTLNVDSFGRSISTDFLIRLQDLLRPSDMSNIVWHRVDGFSIRKVGDEHHITTSTARGGECEPKNQKVLIDWLVPFGPTRDWGGL